MLGDNQVWPYETDVKGSERFLVIPFDVTLNGNASTLLTYQIAGKYDFIVSVMNAYSSQSDGFSFNIRDGKTFTNLFTGKVRNGLVTGDGKNSFLMPKQHRFENGKTIEIEITNLSAASNVIQVALIGHRDGELGQIVSVPKSGMSGYEGAGKVDTYKIERLFVLPFNFTMLGSNYSDKFPISTEFDFIWEELNAYSKTSAGVSREFNLQIKDELVTEELFTSPVRSSLITGDGAHPFILPRPYIFRGGTFVNVSITDTDPAAVNAATVQLIFIGYKARKIS